MIKHDIISAIRNLDSVDRGIPHTNALNDDIVGPFVPTNDESTVL